MDGLSRFPSGVPEVKLTSAGGKTLDDITDGLDGIAVKQENVLEQLRLTHIGHEEETWGKEIRKDEYELDLEDMAEE